MYNMVLLQFRVHPKCPEDIEKLISFIISRGCPALVVKEIDANREHLHCNIHFPLTKSTFGQQFKKVFPKYEGNTDFGITQIKCIEDMDAYICKGDSREDMPVILAQQGHYKDNNLIRACHVRYWDKNDELKANSKKKKKEYVSFVEECYNECIALGNWQSWDWNPVSKKIVFDKVMDMLGKKAKVIDVFIIRRHCYGVMNMLNSTATKAYFWEQVEL